MTEMTAQMTAVICQNVKILLDMVSLCILCVFSVGGGGVT
jgi:hypothetical protein